MSQFERLDQLLASSVPNDAWSDDGVLSAVELLRSFRPADWGELTRMWEHRPEPWQCLAADVLSDGNPESASAVLVEFIARGSEQVKRGACDSLRALLESRRGAIEVHPDIKAIVGRLRNESSGLLAQSLSRLQEMLLPKL